MAPDVVLRKLDALRESVQRVENRAPETLEALLAERLRPAVGFRNLAVHRYDDIDGSIVLGSRNRRCAPRSHAPPEA